MSLRRRVVRTSSDDRNSQLKKSSTAASFRPKLERLIQEGRIEHLMNQDASSKNNLLYTVLASTPRITSMTLTRNWYRPRSLSAHLWSSLARKNSRLTRSRTASPESRGRARSFGGRPEQLRTYPLAETETRQHKRPPEQQEGRAGSHFLGGKEVQSPEGQRIQGRGLPPLQVRGSPAAARRRERQSETARKQIP